MFHPIYAPLRLPEDREALAGWLSAHPWPYHASGDIHFDEALRRIDNGGFSGDDQESYWIMGNELRLGLIRVFDLDDIDDGNPMFDLRLAESARGHGLGRQALEWLTGLMFQRYPQLQRLAGNTRDDNLAMQAVFRHCGYALEGRFREAWNCPDGSRRDSLYFGILRREWERRRQPDRSFWPSTA